MIGKNIEDKNPLGRTDPSHDQQMLNPGKEISFLSRKCWFLIGYNHCGCCDRRYRKSPGIMAVTDLRKHHLSEEKRTLWKMRSVVLVAVFQEGTMAWGSVSEAGEAWLAAPRGHIAVKQSISSPQLSWKIPTPTRSSCYCLNCKIQFIQIWVIKIATKTQCPATELCLPQKRYVEILNLRFSDHDLIWK